MMDFIHSPTTLTQTHPLIRPRRLRASTTLRAMVRETELNVKDFIYPIFVRHGHGRTAIPSMPGIDQLSVEETVREAYVAAQLGIPAILLFGIPALKDPIGMENFAPDGIVQQAIRAIKKEIPELVVITDVCLCEYTEHGHCGILNTGEFYRPQLPQGYVLNDETLDVLERVALSHAECGADIVAPSGMMDGMIEAIRNGLDGAGYENVLILSYAVKYASSFYAPFRQAAEGAPKFGDRKSHQMDPANAHEALREAQLDIEQGADLIMVKPALPYLDVIQKIKSAYPQIPMAAYNVSGEYAMLKAAAINGWLDERQTVLETLTAIKRAGADVIITYHAVQAARWLNE